MTARMIPQDEATTVQRPERGPWVWPDHIYAMISDSAKVLTIPGDGLLALECALNFTESLYRCGYAIVKIEQEDAR